VRLNWFDSVVDQWMGGIPRICVFAEVCGRSLAIEKDGSLYACDHFVYPEHRLGNLADKTRQIAGAVDINDLTIVLAHYNTTGAVWSQGDFNYDGRVDINDLTIVLANYHQTLSASGLAAASVPEPSSVVFLPAAVACLAAVARRRARRAAPTPPRSPRWGRGGAARARLAWQPASPPRRARRGRGARDWRVFP
jgi:hypothetical protein